MVGFLNTIDNYVSLVNLLINNSLVDKKITSRTRILEVENDWCC